MKKVVFTLIVFSLSVITTQAQTRADSLRADSIYKSLELQDVVVVQQKSLVKSDIDKLTYDIESDPDSKSNTILEMLRKIPMVTVDGEDNIQVNGSSSFKVYVNNKPNQMMSNNPKEVLKSMPATSIKKIEVITNPGPKYDAEGVGGILNIITHNQGIEGYTATFSGSVSNRGAAGSTYATVKSGKLTMSANYNYQYTDSPRSYSGGSRKTIGNLSESSSDIDNEGWSKGNSKFHYGTIEASYEIDTLRLVSASFDLWGGRSKSNSERSVAATSPLTQSKLYSYHTVGTSKNNYSAVYGSVDYQRSFSLPERLFTLSYRIATEPDKTDAYTNYTDMQAVDGWENFLQRLKNQHNDGDQNTTEHTFQADYTTPFSKIHTLETGMKYILRNNRSEDDRYEQPAVNSSEYTYDQEHSSHYKHRNDIFAAYLGYGLQLEKLSARLGLRYEHTLQDVEYLNPYIDDTTPTNIQQGNSFLDSEKNHTFSLRYSSFTPKFNINLALLHGFTRNSIESVTKLLPDTQIPGLKNPTGKEVLYTTYENIGHVQGTYLTAYVNWNATKSTRIYMNNRLSYTDMNDGGTLRNHGWDFYAYGGAQQTLPKDWQLSFNFYTFTPSITLQGRSNSYSSYSMGIQKSWLDKRLNLTLSATNFLKKYKNYKSSMEDLYFRSDNWTKSVVQRFSLSISYRIGELKASVRKAERTISNDDVKGGGSSNGSSE